MSFNRRTALRYLGSATALPLFHSALAQSSIVGLVASESFTPRFLDARDVKTVARLAALIIPRTDSPGAADKAVHEYIDYALSESDRATQKSFQDGLRWLDEHVAASRHRRFVELDDNEQHQLLEEISDTSRSHEPTGYAFFTQLKQLSIEGYYLSEVGMYDRRRPPSGRS